MISQHPCFFFTYNKINSSIMQSTAHKDPTISSNTKYACPFSKTPRFPSNTSNCPQAFYSYNSQLSTRKTSLGYGKRSQINCLLPNTPASNRYRIQSTIVDRGVSFGCARQKSPDRSFMNPHLAKNPGVGQYENQVRTRMPQQYTINGKTIDVIEKAKMSHYTPGPGAYEFNDFQNRSGRHSNSKYCDSKYGTISHSQRFPQIRKSTGPGPSSYAPEDGDADNGHYTLSKFHGKGGRVFERAVRFTGTQFYTGSPGPANYEVPTEFGRTMANFHNNI